ncbi:hypothetical protein D8674_023033 [Pyrus ussuriensis x Pyrus communis]|uniref:Uncharacterized protein n=1 Tax=Pyrus ussuriensis x Pyrus communis TaxID=2448454 RepID=A0A5N5GLM3_9ROSA|nr:hypothetical protein D8674_023033 [Pyrus ussuriensis x Pyrus communis]
MKNRELETPLKQRDQKSRFAKTRGRLGRGCEDLHGGGFGVGLESKRFQQVGEEVRGADCRQRVVANNSVILGEVKGVRRLEVVECSKWVMACLGCYCFGLLWFCW